MAMLLTAQQMMHTKASHPYPIKNPNQVVNGFTVKEESIAAQTLKLKDEEKTAQLKDFLKGYDMASISTDDLKKVGSRLYDDGVIDEYAFGLFISGSGAFDADGKQTDTHVKFNAIALFNEKLENHLAYFEKNSKAGNTPGMVLWRNGLITANHVINAMAYFVNSSKSEVAINESV